MKKLVLVMVTGLFIFGCSNKQIEPVSGVEVVITKDMIQNYKKYIINRN